MEAFTYCIPSNESLYKGSPEIAFKHDYHVPSWFSLNRNTACKYGGHVHKLKIVRPLKLVNVMSHSFHNWLMDHTVDKFREFTYADVYKNIMELLVPLGLPNREDQAIYLEQEFGIPSNLITSDYRDYGKFVQNKSRISMKHLDAALVTELYKFFHQKGFHGYIAPNKWPSTFHGLFDDEICIFDIGNIVELGLVMYVEVSLAETRQRAGNHPITVDVTKVDRSKMIDTQPDLPWKEVWNNARIYSMRTSGYTGPIKYDSDGYVVLLTIEEIIEYKKQQSSDDGTQQTVHHVTYSRT